MKAPLYNYIKGSYEPPVDKDYVHWKLRGGAVAKDDRGNEYRKIYSAIEDDYVPRRVDYKDDVINKIFEALQGINGSVFNLRLDVDWFNPGDVLQCNGRQIVIEEYAKPMYDHFHYVARRLR